MGEKIHPPTPHKIALARKNGQVWRAALLIQGIGIIVFYCVANKFKTMVLDALHKLLQLGGSPETQISESLGLGIWAGIGIVFVMLLIVAVLSSLFFCALGGFVLSAKPVSPAWSRVDPAAGFARVFGALKDGWQICTRLFFAILVFGCVIATGSLRDSPASLGFRVFSAAAMILLFLGIFDAVFKRRKFFADQRMTDEELRRETRDNDGDPLMKAMQRSMRESLSRGEMVARLRRAKVLVVRRAGKSNAEREMW